jgi:putative PIN family toxin of toxin-antitoxin system
VRVVLDTSVLFAAFRLDVGFCCDLFRQCVLRHDIVTSEFILEELRRHLTGKGKISVAKVAEVIDAIRSAAIVVSPALVASDACRDLNDLPVLGTALAGHADALVTGDNDLLVLNRFQAVQILSPRAFHETYLKH